MIVLIYRWHVYVESPKESTKQKKSLELVSEFNKVMEYKVKKNQCYLSILTMNNWKFK